jgi:trimeric autotransporter adhesin
MMSYIVLGCVCAFLYGVTALATTFPVTLDKKLGATIKSHSSQLKYLQNQVVQSNSGLTVANITLEQHSTQIAAVTVTADNALPIVGGTITGNLAVDGTHTVTGNSTLNGNVTVGGNHIVDGYVSVGGAGAGSTGDILNTGTVHAGGVSSPTGVIEGGTITSNGDVDASGGTVHAGGVSSPNGVIVGGSITSNGDVVATSGTVHAGGISAPSGVIVGGTITSNDLLNGGGIVLSGTPGDIIVNGTRMTVP